MPISETGRRLRQGSAAGHGCAEHARSSPLDVVVDWRHPNRDKRNIGSIIWNFGMDCMATQMGSQAVERASALLGLIVESGAPRTFSSLVDELGVAK